MTGNNFNRCTNLFLFYVSIFQCRAYLPIVDCMLYTSWYPAPAQVKKPREDVAACIKVNFLLLFFGRSLLFIFSGSGPAHRKVKGKVWQFCVRFQYHLSQSKRYGRTGEENAPQCKCPTSNLIQIYLRVLKLAVQARGGW